MPKRAAVSSDQLFLILKNLEGIISPDGNVAPPSSIIWKNASISIQGTMSSKYIYVYVRENRNDIQNKLRAHFGIGTEDGDIGEVELLKEFKILNDEESNDSFDSSFGKNSNTNVLPPIVQFRTTLSSERWEEIKPTCCLYGAPTANRMRRYSVLSPGLWTHYIAEALWDQHSLPCAYVFKRAKVYEDEFNRQHFLIIEGHCKECGAVIKGHADKEPKEGEELEIIFITPNTKGVNHSKKRPLSGEKRKEFKENLKHQDSSVFRRKKINDLIYLGEQDPPILPKLQVLRKAKQEGRDEMFIFPKIKDPIRCVEHMKHMLPYVGSIHDIASDKLMVHYWSPTQMYVYKKLCTKEGSKLCVDATGSLIKKVKRPSGLSGHIFLYEGVIYSDGIQVPVVQMLSEKHDTNTILYFLNEWIRSGATFPKEIVSDSSKALLGALVRSFGRCIDLNQYLDKCFKALTEDIHSKPSCFIRMDIAHLLKRVSEWKSLTNCPKRVKDFYMRCIALMVKCVSLDDFVDLLIMVLTISISETDGSKPTGAKTCTELSRNKLTKLISTHYIEREVNVDNYTYKTEELSDCDIDEHVENTPNIAKLIQDARSTAEKNSSEEGDRVNAYLNFNFSNDICRLAKDFPLWTAVMVPIFNCTNLVGSSASVESDFADLKHRILKNETKPIVLHKFIAIHLESIEGSMKIAAAPNKYSTPPRDNTSQTLLTKENINIMKQHSSLLSINRSCPNSTTDTILSIRSKSEVNKVSNNASELISERKYSEDRIIQNNNCEGGLILNKHECEPEYIDFTAIEKESSELNFTENWRGLNLPPKKRTLYMNPFPEIMAIQETPINRKLNLSLLKNGNLCPCIVFENKSVQIQNTCSFDALCQSLGIAYIDYNIYQTHVNSSKNATLAVVRSLVTKGAVKETYIERAQILTQIFEPSKNWTNLLTYNCETNLSRLIEKLFIDEPTITKTKICSTAECTFSDITNHIILDLNSATLLQNGLRDLQNIVNNETRTKHVHCNVCPGILSSHINVGQHVFIDIEILEAKGFGESLGLSSVTLKQYSLGDIPVNLIICGVEVHLVAVIAHVPGHYIAYTRRIYGTWEVHNDLSKKIYSTKNNIKVWPNILVYVRK